MFRKYKKIEGRWIEIVPNFDRGISICKIYFKNNSYHMDGTNFSAIVNESVEFKTKKFIEGDDTEFYYITECNRPNKLEGFGKVYDISKSCKGYYVAKGFFFDVLDDGNQRIHKTHMIKFDKKFYDRYLSIKRNVEPERFTDYEVFESVKEYVTKNYNVEVKL